MSDQPRHDAGVPTGGQFAATVRNESHVSLDAEAAEISDLRERLSSLHEYGAQFDVNTIEASAEADFFRVVVAEPCRISGRRYTAGDVATLDKTSLAPYTPVRLVDAGARLLAEARLTEDTHPFYNSVDPESASDFEYDGARLARYQATVTRDLVLSGYRVATGAQVTLDHTTGRAIGFNPSRVEEDAESLNRTGWGMDGQWQESGYALRTAGGGGGRYEARSLTGGVLHTDDLVEAVAHVENGARLGSVIDFKDRTPKSVGFDERFVGHPIPTDLL